MPKQRPTCRQLEVLRAYIRAGSVAVAAYELGIGETTVRQHLSGPCRRTGCLNAPQAAYWPGTRCLAGSDRDATNPDQWKAAIGSYADRFTGLVLQPPRTSVVRGKDHDELWRLLHDQRRLVIAALHYGTLASEKRSLCASRSFRGSW